MRDNNWKKFLNLSIKDIFGIGFFVIIPFSFFFSNFIAEYKVLYYAVLALFIAILTLVLQFFFEKSSFGYIGRKLIILSIINTIILSLIYFSGSLESPYFFILYFLIFFTAIFASDEILIAEVMVLFMCVFVGEFVNYGSISQMLSSLNFRAAVSLMSLPVSLPLTIAMASFIENLKTKEDLLLLSKDILAIKEIEDEALLEEISQGIIVIDKSLKIIKISKWIEINFNLSAKFFLGRPISEIEFYDPVLNVKLKSTDYFFVNLKSSTPQKLKWRILYKNQYGKFKKFIVGQIPMKLNGEVIGFIISVKFPPKNISDLLSSYSRVFSFKLSSSIAMVKNLLSISKQCKIDPVYPNIIKNLELVINLLNDAAIKDDIVDGDREIQITEFNLKKIIELVIGTFNPVRKISLWNVSPLYQTQGVKIKSDKNLCQELIRYSLKGALYFSTDETISVSLDEDENVKRPSLLVSVSLKEQMPEMVRIIEPFFAGEIDILSKYRGTGLEISNANLIANFLGFDFDARISNNKLIIKIIF